MFYLYLNPSCRSCLTLLRNTKTIAANFPNHANSFPLRKIRVSRGKKKVTSIIGCNLGYLISYPKSQPLRDFSVTQEYLKSKTSYMSLRGECLSRRSNLLKNHPVLFDSTFPFNMRLCRHGAMRHFAPLATTCYVLYLRHSP